MNKIIRITIIKAYAPTSAAADEEIEEFYNTLDHIAEDNYSGFLIIIGGINAQVGRKMLRAI